ncbi:MAG: CHASE3 domain-containing protein [Planctomycetaceae bacterium]|nr:CHASE3 domain-containing protein [Planctomycetaceae bacterium]
MRVRTKIICGFGAILAIVAFGGVAAYISTQRLIMANHQTVRTVRVMESLTEALSNLRDAVINQRGYLLTGKQEYLSSYERALGNIPIDLDRVEKRVRDDADQAQRLRRLRELVQARTEILQKNIRLRKDGGLEAVLGQIGTDYGKSVTDAIDNLIDQMKAHEQQALESRRAEAMDGVAVATWSMLVGVPLLVLGLAIAAAVFVRDIAQPIETITRTAENISRGELTLPPDKGRRRTRSDEIGSLQASFDRMTAWLMQIAGAARRVATGDYTTTIVPSSGRDELGQSLATMLGNLLASKEELRRSQHEYATLFEASIVGQAQADAATRRFTRVNEAMATMTGYSVAELCRMSPRDLTHPEDRQRDAQTTAPVWEGAADRWQIEKRFVRKDGAAIWVNVAGASIRGPNGKPERLIAVIQDITERKRVEQALCDSEQRLRLAQQGARIGSFDWDFASGVNTWTAELEAMYGLQRGQFGKTETSWEQLVYKDDRQAAIAVVNRALETGQAVQGQWRVQWPDGSIHWISGRFQVATDAEGKAVRLTGVNIDITDLKAAQQELEQANRMLLLLSECNEAVIRIDDEQRLTEDICRIAVGIGGYQMAWVGMARDDEGKSVLPVASVGFEGGYLENAHISWGDCERGNGPTGTAIRTGQIQIGSDFLTDPTLGPWREEAVRRGYRSSIALPLRQDQSIIGALTIYASQSGVFGEPHVRVLSELAENLSLGLNALRMRAALRENRDRLRALAGELTLTEQRERGRFARMLHDHLQQLLVGAKFRVAILSRTDDSVVRQGVKEVEALLDESISASRSLTAELSPPILHEGRLCDGLEWLARWMAGKHGLFVELSLQRNASPAAEDVKVLLFEAVRELLFNAVKHSGTKSASVSLRRLNGDRIHITVCDEGQGFDPKAIKPVGALGQGFGLFSIRERLSLVGGQFEIDSAPGKGSRFSITAPMGSPAPATAPPATMRAVLQASGESLLASPTTTPGASIRVLLVDDHTVMRQGLALLLGSESDISIVGQAADGLEAVELAGQLRPDVILMDVSLPRLNGIDATAAIHKDWPDIRIIGLSMFEEKERAEAMRDAGACAYLIKSGPSEQLIAAIRGHRP